MHGISDTFMPPYYLRRSFAKCGAVTLIGLLLGCATASPVFAYTANPVYSNGKYVGCTFYYNILEEFVFGWQDETLSPSRVSEDTCKGIGGPPFTIAYVAGSTLGDDFVEVARPLLDSPRARATAAHLDECEYKPAWWIRRHATIQ